MKSSQCPYLDTCSPVKETRSGRTTKKPQYLEQERLDGADKYKKMSHEERMELLKKTLKKSARLTERLLQKLDKEWDDVFKEDESEDDTAVHSIHSSEDESDSKASIQSLETIEKALKRRAVQTRHSRRLAEEVNARSVHYLNSIKLLFTS